jgi:hypothetical protein
MAASREPVKQSPEKAAAPRSHSPQSPQRLAATKTNATTVREAVPQSPVSQ